MITQTTQQLQTSTCLNTLLPYLCCRCLCESRRDALICIRSSERNKFSYKIQWPHICCDCLGFAANSVIQAIGMLEFGDGLRTRSTGKVLFGVDTLQLNVHTSSSNRTCFLKSWRTRMWLSTPKNLDTQVYDGVYANKQTKQMCCDYTFVQGILNL